MHWRLRMELRRRWAPAPGWPPAPIGFLPPNDWAPHPTWPMPAAGWTGWRAHRDRLTAAAVLGAVAVFCLYGVLRSASADDRQSALAKRGVRTTATVVHSSYDAGAGDPGGWTTDEVAFIDRDGKTFGVTVGHHHDDAPEEASGHLLVIYDPAKPTTVMSVLDYQNDQSAGGVVIGTAFLAIFGLTGIGFLISAVRFTVEGPSRPHGLQRSS